MKKNLSFLFILATFCNIFACRCVLDNFAQDYLEADFVGVITISETFGERKQDRNGSQMDVYKAKINVEKIYKGKAFSELNIFGKTTYAYSGACEKLVKSNEKYFILLQKNSNGEYYVSLCSPMSKLYNEKSINQQLKKEQKIINYLERNQNKFLGLKFVDYYDNSENWDHANKKTITDFTKTFDKKLNNKFGVYKVKIDNKEKITEIITIKESGLDEKIIQLLMKKNLELDNYFNQNANDEYLILLRFD